MAKMSLIIGRKSFPFRDSSGRKMVVENMCGTSTRSHVISNVYVENKEGERELIGYYFYLEGVYYRGSETYTDDKHEKHFAEYFWRKHNEGNH